LSSTLEVVLRQVRVPIPQSKVLQREYRKRELAVPVRATGAPDFRIILSNITVYNYDTTHLQENPQRLG